jgi:3D-(3,5/4)-trihydroxycyclohexane-1,2-dione acylhydrolase (decyclizing)
VDLAANAESLGVRVTRARTIDEFRNALKQAKGEKGPVLVQVETDPLVPAPNSESWWDVPVAEASNLDSTRKARRSYEVNKGRQRNFVGAGGTPESEPVGGTSR